MYDNLTEKMMAVRHVNGRDWWLVNKDRHSFSYIKTLLVDDKSLSFYRFDQKIGYTNSIGDGRDGMIKFSKNGKRLCTVHYVAWTAVDLLDFNRKNGMLENPRYYNGTGNEYFACELDSTGDFTLLSTYSENLDCGTLFFCKVTSDSLLIYDTLKVTTRRAIMSPQLKEKKLIFIDKIFNAYPLEGCLR